MDLLRLDDLPPGWRYPAAFLRLVDRGVTYLEPWYVLTGSQLRRDAASLRVRHPDCPLVPFARREDRDDVACWDTRPGAGGTRVVVVRHTCGTALQQATESVVVFPTFEAWVLSAVLDMLAHDAASTGQCSRHPLSVSGAPDPQLRRS